jgi:Fatty acid hydroxylase superfamily
MTRLRLLFSHATLWTMALVVVSGIAVVLTDGRGWLWPLALLGIPAQMVNEYLLHRFIFHLPPPRRQWYFDWLYRAHYGHHDFPTNPDLLFVPFFVMIPVLAGNFALAFGIFALLGTGPALGPTAAVVMIGGGATFIAYEWFHATAHMNVSTTALERHVATLHNQHHFRDFSKWYHVTAGGELIDRAFGTAISRDALKSRQRLEFIRTLGLRPDDPRLVAARLRFAHRYGLTEAEIVRAAKV